jgi:6,7-dimethyl-8-ribityllumazine synthase
MSIRELEPNLAGKGLRVGVVQARFNENIGEGLRSGCLTELARLGVADDDVTCATGPGRTGIAADAAGHGPEQTFRCAGCAGCGDPRRDLSLRDRLQRIGARHHRRATELRHSHRQCGADHRERRSGAGAHGAKGHEAAQAAIEMANLLALK